jgi:hypothetical protein
VLRQRACHRRTLPRFALPQCADLARPAAPAQANKDRLEVQAEGIEQNIKELLKTNEALARQIMAQ